MGLFSPPLSRERARADLAAAETEMKKAEAHQVSVNMAREAGFPLTLRYIAAQERLRKAKRRARWAR